MAYVINYDIYVSQAVNPRLDLQKLIPRILEENGVCYETEQDFPFDGFIGLDISAELAKSLWYHLKSKGIKSVVAPSIYREPVLTKEAALSYANSVAEHKKSQDLSDKFGELYYAGEEIMWYAFRVFSEKMREEKRSPGSWYILIDKIDGHVWKDTQEIMSVTMDTWFY